MSGTSSASPMISGIVALMKEARPSMSWIQAHLSLATTADDVTEQKTTPCGLIKDCINHVTNSYGYKHSYSVGFGAVNGDAAIDNIKKVKVIANPTRYSYVMNKNQSLKILGSKEVTPQQCASYKLVVPSNYQVYSLELSFSYTGVVKDVGLFMKMPNGAVAQILRPSSIISGESLTFDHYHKSMQALGINARGTWEFEVCSKSAGSFGGVSMDIYGWKSLSVIARKSVAKKDDTISREVSGTYLTEDYIQTINNSFKITNNFNIKNFVTKNKARFKSMSIGPSNYYYSDRFKVIPHSLSGKQKFEALQISNVNFSVLAESVAVNDASPLLIDKHNFQLLYLTGNIIVKTRPGYEQQLMKISRELNLKLSRLDKELSTAYFKVSKKTDIMSQVGRILKTPGVIQAVPEVVGEYKKPN